ncbi:MAG: sigma factor-like helix-turn-helix DNA-binding protein [Bacilli bacterium]|nr:sigma factor-like helix-turn-helix DNA-binding protein [Bacilli bacterium]
MDLLEKKNFYNNLYDYYHELLTPKQREYFQKYYFEDLSLAEIAAFYEVSRNAIHDQLQSVYHSLESYEEKLGLFDQAQRRNEIYEEYLKTGNHKIIEMIEKLKNLE